MTFWQIFLRTLPRRPFAALAGLWWQLTGRRVRARNRLLSAGARMPFAYRFWMDKVEPELERRRGTGSQVENFVWRPEFTVVLAVDGCSEQDVLRSVDSVERQIYPNWTLSLVAQSPAAAPLPAIKAVPTQSSWKMAIASAAGDFLVPLRAGDQLSAGALLRYAEAVQAEPETRIIFGDQDAIDAAGTRHNPWFKPRWNEEYFLAQDYLSDAVAVRTQAAHQAIEGLELEERATAYDLVMRIARNSGAIVHAPYVTTHVRTDLRSENQAERIKVVGAHLAGTGAEAWAGPFGTVKVSWPLPRHHPMVSIIIPTRDKVELLRPCIESVLAKTNYGPFEVLIVDNDSVEERTRAFLAGFASHPQIRVLPYAGAYNFSAINNFAVRESTGPYICFLNNDTEVVEKEWLTEMMRQAIRPLIGAVGAKLLYTDGTIQHAGVVVGMGDAAGHAHRNLPNKESGYFSQVHAAQFVTAVTGACLLVHKQKFLGVHGFDEEGLAVAYNDVDLCLKLERAGWRNVYVPHAVLIHHESKSRGKDHSPGQIDRYRRELKVFQERWGTETYNDPLLNPNLERSSETFVIRL